MIISLSASVGGPACAIADSIKRHFYDNSREAHMFDYLIVSMASINKTLGTYTPETIFNALSHYAIDTSTEWNLVHFKEFENMTSVHDLPKVHTLKNEYDVVFKYVRRFKRFLEVIKNSSQVFFIRYAVEPENTSDVQAFFQIIQTLNPSIKVYYINTYFAPTEHKKYVLDLPNVFNINFSKALDSDKKYSENPYIKIMEHDWEPVRNLIDSQINML